METISKFLYINFDYIILTTIIIFTILISSAILDINFDFIKNANFNEEPNRVINVETMENKKGNHPEFTGSFCNNYENNHVLLNEKCKNLGYESCNSTRCTVWVNNSNGGKCHSGDSDGPHLKGTLESPLEIHNYHYKNACIPGTKKCE